MKKPQSLYLSALAHNRLSTYVDNALDGAGSLSGFFAHIEERTHAMVGSGSAIPSEHAANKAFESLSLLDYRNLRQPLTAYNEAWDDFTAALPWFAGDPVGAHVLALNLLTEFPSLWEVEYGQRELPRHHLDSHAVSLSMAIERIRTPYTPAVQIVDRSTPRWRWARPILGRDRIDFIVADRHVPVSIYLDTEAHQLFYAAFGNLFFTRLEHSLIHLLEDPEAVIDIESAALFLEHGPTGVDLNELELAANEIPRTVIQYKSPAPGRGRDGLTEEELAKHARQKGYASLQDPALLCFGLDFLYLRRRDIDRFLWADKPNLAPNVADGTLATLHLGNRLHLIDGTDVRELPQRIARALAERFGITEVAPTRDNAFRLLAAAQVRDNPRLAFTNAVDLHMWGLFIAYARHCLPHVPTGHPRVSHSTLVTLAEGDLFPRVGVIEAITGTKVRKTPSGAWQLRKGRKTHAELDHQSFLRVGEALEGFVHLRDPITVPGDWDESFTDPDGATEPKPYSYVVSPTVIERVVRVLDTHTEETRRQALEDILLLEQPRRRQAVAKGVRHRA